MHYLIRSGTNQPAEDPSEKEGYPHRTAVPSSAMKRVITRRLRSAALSRLSATRRFARTVNAFVHNIGILIGMYYTHPTNVYPLLCVLPTYFKVHGTLYVEYFLTWRIVNHDSWYLTHSRYTYLPTRYVNITLMQLPQCIKVCATLQPSVNLLAHWPGNIARAWSIKCTFQVEPYRDIVMCQMQISSVYKDLWPFEKCFSF